MHEAHDALILGKTYINDKKRLRLSNEHYLKNNDEMSKLFHDLPQALENNYNIPYRCHFRPVIKPYASKYILVQRIQTKI